LTKVRNISNLDIQNYDLFVSTILLFNFLYMQNTIILLLIKYNVWL